MSKINTQLTRDPRFVEAQAKLTELKTDLNELERQRDEVNAGLLRLPSQRDLIQSEASLLLDGKSQAATTRDTLIRSLTQLSHRVNVLREAIEIQKGRVLQVRTEVSKVIAAEVEPAHREAVASIARAVLNLAEAVQREHEIREDLALNDVMYSATLRPMTIGGFLLEEGQGRAARFLLEAAEHGYIDPKMLPASVRKWIPTKPSAKPAASRRERTPKEEDWTPA